MARIFVVEDDAALRGELMRLLELQGHEALASTAFDRIADEVLAADPDCVLLDLKLPGDGSMPCAATCAAQATCPSSCSPRRTTSSTRS